MAIVQRNTPQLSEHDVAIWHTIEINLRLDQNTLHFRQPVATPFPLRLEQGEIALAHSDFTLRAFTSGGDGSYHHSGGFFLATGPGGLALSALVGLGRAAGNARRRSDAAAAAQAAWRTVEVGSLTVSSAGFYRGSTQGFFSWPWSAVEAADLVAPGALQFSGQSTNGPGVWIVTSPWSELLFTLWARRIHPLHPTYAARRWVPEGWLERLTRAGHQPPTLAPQDAPG